VGDDPFEQKVARPEEHAERKREPWEKVALWWRTVFPIGAFLVGVVLLLSNSLRANPSGITYGVGLVLAGLGPAGLIDVIKKIP
jgi:hypothetical protein